MRINAGMRVATEEKGMIVTKWESARCRELLRAGEAREAFAERRKPDFSRSVG
jgi:hypothetical protein